MVSAEKLLSDSSVMEQIQENLDHLDVTENFADYEEPDDYYESPSLCENEDELQPAKKRVTVNIREDYLKILEDKSGILQLAVETAIMMLEDEEEIAVLTALKGALDDLEHEQ